MIRINNWQDTFENADTRKRQRLGWFLAPSGTDSKGYRHLMRLGDRGILALGMFQALCQSMATMPRETRGKFTDSNGTSMELADIWEITRTRPADYRQILLDLSDVGWITVDPEALGENPPAACHQSAGDLPPSCHLLPSFVKGEGEGEGEGEVPLTPKGECGQESLFDQSPMKAPVKRRLTGREKLRTKVEANTPLMVRIGSWFSRLPTTLWTVAEEEALQAVNPTPAEIDGMDFYYTSHIHQRDDFRRRDLITLLNNWSGELDRARAFAEKSA